MWRLKSLKSKLTASVFTTHKSPWPNVLLLPSPPNSSISPLYPASHSFPHSSAHRLPCKLIVSLPLLVSSHPVRAFSTHHPLPFTLFLSCFLIMSLFSRQLFKLLSVQQTTEHSSVRLLTHPFTSKTTVPACVYTPLLTNIWHQNVMHTSLHKHGDFTSSGAFAQQVHHLIVAHVLDVSLVDLHQNIPLF